MILAAERINHRLPGALVALVLSVAAVDTLSWRRAMAWRSSVPSTDSPGAHPVGFLVAATPSAGHGAHRGLPLHRPDSGHGPGVERGPAGGRRFQPGPDRRRGRQRRRRVIGGFAVDASPPNTAIVTASGARSQLTNIIAAVVVLIVVVALTGPLADVPLATLGRPWCSSPPSCSGSATCGPSSVSTASSSLWPLPPSESWPWSASSKGSYWPSSSRWRTGPGAPLDPETPSSAVNRTPITGSQSISAGRPSRYPGFSSTWSTPRLWYGNADYLRLRVCDLVDAAPDPVHTVILNATGMSDIDYTGLQALRALADELEQRGIAVGIARTSHLVHRDLRRGALLKQLGPDHLFVSVEAAVTALQRRS